jgi:predicted  nucleic acid-binding Zn-ribbon protein
VFSVLNEERSSVVAGLDRFGARQKELATSIRDDNEKLRALRSDQTATAAEVNQMVQQITWEAQVFQDRRQALRYACDVPGKIEQRLFAVARAVEDALH